MVTTVEGGSTHTCAVWAMIWTARRGLCGGRAMRRCAAYPAGVQVRRHRSEWEDFRRSRPLAPIPTTRLSLPGGRQPLDERAIPWGRALSGEKRSWLQFGTYRDHAKAAQGLGVLGILYGNREERSDQN